MGIAGKWIFVILTGHPKIKVWGFLRFHGC
jgi:hypothetical protein